MATSKRHNGLTYRVNWRSPETLAAALGLLRDPGALAFWLEAGADDAELAAMLQARLHAGALALCGPSPYWPLLRLALKRVDYGQLAEQLHIERSRLAMWEGLRHD